MTRALSSLQILQSTHRPAFWKNNDNMYWNSLWTYITSCFIDWICYNWIPAAESSVVLWVALKLLQWPHFAFSFKCTCDIFSREDVKSKDCSAVISSQMSQPIQLCLLFFDVYLFLYLGRLSVGYCSHDVGGSEIYLSGVLTTADLYPNLAAYLR